MTHQECCDGAGCAVVFIEAGGKEENIRYVSAGGMERWIKKDPSGDIVSGRFIIVADLGITSSRLSGDLEKRGDVVLLDHHKTSQHLSGLSWCSVEMESCGTKLLLDYLELADPRWEEFANLIEDHDRWLNRMLPVSRELVVLMGFMGQKEFVKRMSDFPYRRKHFDDMERFALDHLERQAEARIRSALNRVVKVQQEWGMTAYLVSSETNISAMLHQALEENPDCVMAVQVNIDKNMVSLRSRPGFDCESVARQFGGGGHAQASGHPLPPLLTQMIVDEVH